MVASCALLLYPQILWMWKSTKFQFLFDFYEAKTWFPCRSYSRYVIFYRLHLKSIRKKNENFTMDPYGSKWKVIKGIFHLIHWEIIINARIWCVFFYGSLVKECSGDFIITGYIWFLWELFGIYRYSLMRPRLNVHAEKNIMTLEYVTRDRCLMLKKI